ncbi:hypothetical protein CV102_05235 [Natronococcus pandeyae]|uniref:Origin-associated protein OapC n=1 Tax=Natronococcus pandeyae TaxID=2055836 RepID=A0A8J8Q5I2_9EURY|nr:Zn-ribbon containing protein [Natronococcus pandeyae]TYL39691.1 hypothetical protein CV102_05235 [Natronococcus pandeyae]
MPHQCTNCGRTFPDGSKEMLSGCPDCGGNKFQFAPSSGTTAAGTASESNAGAGGDRTGVAETSSGDDSEADPDGVASRAAETVRGWVSSGSPDESTGGSTRDATTADPATDTATADAATTDTATADTTTDTTGTDTTATDTTTDATASETTNIESPSTSPENAERGHASESASSSSETQPGTTSAAESEGFSEWPDSARRPEDRSSGTESGADQSVTAQSPTDQTTATRSVTEDQSVTADRSAADDRSVADDQPTGATDVETNAHPVESEDSAQASARSEVVPADDLPVDAGQDGDSGVVTDVGGNTEAGADSRGDQPPNDGRVVSEPSGEQPSIEDLRAELNEQFESIKIVRPGQYELNLMELYNRDEYIISLQEDGRYVIDVPDSWHDGADE